MTAPTVRKNARTPAGRRRRLELAKEAGIYAFKRLRQCRADYKAAALDLLEHSEAKPFELDDFNELNEYAGETR